MKLYISIPISGRPLHEAKYHAECIEARDRYNAKLDALIEKYEKKYYKDRK